MSAEVIAVLIGGCFALIGTLLGAYLNKRATLTTARDLAEIERFKYTQDRIWDFRKESYTVILAHLRRAADHADRLFAGYCDEQRHPEQYFESEERQQEEDATWSAWADCRKAFEESRLTISDDFAKQFQLLRHSFRTISDQDLPPEAAHKAQEILNSFYANLLEIAQDEIAPTKPPTIN